MVAALAAAESVPAAGPAALAGFIQKIVNNA
jgi:hypothetical protein